MTQSIETTRRSFLTGLAGVLVLARMPSALAIDPATKDSLVLGYSGNVHDVVPPPGFVYNWKRSALCGEPDIANIEKCLAQGWEFVTPSAHPEMQPVEAPSAIEGGGLVLMQLPIAKAEVLWQAQKDAAKAQYAPYQPMELEDGAALTKSADALDVPH